MIDIQLPQDDIEEQIRRYLEERKSPLAEHAGTIVSEATKQGIDPRLIVATAGAETGFGTNWGKYKPESYNAWSHEFGQGKEGYSNWNEAISDQADYLRRAYVDKGLTSVGSIGQKYAPPGAGNDPRGTNNEWPRMVSGFLSDLGGDPNNVTLNGKPVFDVPKEQAISLSQPIGNIEIGSRLPTIGEVPEAGMPEIAPQNNIEGLGILAPIGEPGAQPIDTNKPAPTPIPQVLPTHTKIKNPDGSITIPETGTTWYKEGFMIKDVAGRKMKIDMKGRQTWLPPNAATPKDQMIEAAARKGILRENFPDEDSFTKAAQESLSLNTLKAGDTDEIAQSIIEGKQPPNLQGLYRQGASVRAALARQGYPLAQAQQDWDATKKYLATLNGAQQLKLRQATEFVKETVPLVRELSADLTQKIPRSQFPVLNSAALLAARNGALGQDAQISATKLTAQINDMQAELATMYRGGNTATDAALKQAGEMLKGNWSEPQLNAALDLVEKNSQIRLNSIKNTGVAGVNEESYPTSGEKAEPVATPSPITSAKPLDSSKLDAARKWLAEHPDDPNAGAVRKRLELLQQ